MPTKHFKNYEAYRKAIAYQHIHHIKVIHPSRVIIAGKPHHVIHSHMVDGHGHHHHMHYMREERGEHEYHHHSNAPHYHSLHYPETAAHIVKSHYPTSMGGLYVSGKLPRKVFSR